MELLRSQIWRCVAAAYEEYKGMVSRSSRSSTDTKILEAFFAPLRKYEGGIPRIFQKQEGQTPVFAVNICFFPDDLWKGDTERVSSLQLSGGFFPNQERPLFTVVEISMPRKIARKKRPDVRADKKTLMPVSRWISPTQRQDSYVYSNKTTKKPERTASLVNKR